MRVFCPEHKRGFFAPRQNPIKCENRGHVLGDMNFAADSRSQVELQWQYCCNCEHFCPISPQGESLGRCPVCTRKTSLLYICDRCFIASFESNTPVHAKNFTLTSEGLPQPSCPGCLQTTSGEVREHFCAELGGSFSTALNACPICGERLDIGPSFPSLVEPYLRKTKTANKLAATFDYDSGLFLPVEDGEFVLIPNGAERNQSFLLPRLTRFTEARQFYEIYQDYYHHRSELRSGAVLIHEPALVEPKREGWKFKSAGLLEVVDEQPKPRPRKIQPTETETAVVETKPPVAPAASEKAKADEKVPTPEKSSPPMVAGSEELLGRACKQCGSIVEDRYTFCWHCGQPMKSDQGGGKPVEASSPPRRMVIDMDDTPTAHPSGGEMPSIFKSELPRERNKFRRGNNSSLKLMLMVVAVGAAVILTTAGVFVFKHATSSLNAALTSQAMSSNLESSQNTVPTVDVADKAAVPEPTQANDAGQASTERPPSEEDELLQLRQKRIAATASDRPKMQRDFVRLEKQYPNDYRFPYEHAKLFVMGATSHEAAFHALFVAAERAIKAGKTHEMLQGLQADKSGDFQKLSHGHPEWTQLVQALKNKDTKLLAANTHVAQAL